MFGGVEAQKTSGSLHYHFFIHVQRLHQYNTLAEIGNLIAQGLASAENLKMFTQNLCYQSYAHPMALSLAQDDIENQFPDYSESRGAVRNEKWGDIKLGRIPEFLYDDAKNLLNPTAETGKNKKTLSNGYTEIKEIIG